MRCCLGRVGGAMSRPAYLFERLRRRLLTGQRTAVGGRCVSAALFTQVWARHYTNSWRRYSPCTIACRRSAGLHPDGERCKCEPTLTLFISETNVFPSRTVSRIWRGARPGGIAERGGRSAGQAVGRGLLLLVVRSDRRSVNSQGRPRMLRKTSIAAAVIAAATAGSALFGGVALADDSDGKDGKKPASVSYNGGDGGKGGDIGLLAGVRAGGLAWNFLKTDGEKDNVSTDRQPTLRKQRDQLRRRRRRAPTDPWRAQEQRCRPSDSSGACTATTKFSPGRPDRPAVRARPFASTSRSGIRRLSGRFVALT